MAMEYVYFDEPTKEPVALRNFRGLYYTYEDGAMEICNGRGEQVGFFTVNRRTCYMLQRRNQSALQLHKVTPPRSCVDVDLWLFGFGKKLRCDSREGFQEACHEYEGRSHQQVKIRDFSWGGLDLEYAFVGRVGTKSDFVPVAYYYFMREGTAWAFNGKEIEYRLIEAVHNAVGGFKYPLQYVIHTFKGNTMSYPVETREFFRKKLGYVNRNDVYYADLPGNF